MCSISFVQTTKQLQKVLEMGPCLYSLGPAAAAAASPAAVAAAQAGNLSLPGGDINSSSDIFSSDPSLVHSHLHGQSGAHRDLAIMSEPEDPNSAQAPPPLPPDVGSEGYWAPRRRIRCKTVDIPQRLGLASKPLHPSHRYGHFAGVTWCWVCGSYATQRPLGLAKRCQHPTDAGVAVLRRIDKGRHPQSNRPFDSDDTHACPVGVRLVSASKGFSKCLSEPPSKPGLSPSFSSFGSHRATNSGSSQDPKVMPHSRVFGPDSTLFQTESSSSTTPKLQGHRANTF